MIFLVLIINANVLAQLVFSFQTHGSGLHRKQSIITYSSTTTSIDTLKEDLFLTLARPNNDRARSVANVVTELESLFDISRIDFPSSICGTWELLYTDDDLTRSSPFFWAFRKALQGVKDPVKVLGPESLSESIFYVTDNIPFKSIGTCTQTFSQLNPPKTSEFVVGKLVSQVEVKVDYFGSSLMTTTSSWRLTSIPNVIELCVDKTQVLKSTIGKLLPFLDDNLSFPSGAALELLRPGSSTVFLTTTFLDEHLRIARNKEDDKVFIYERI